MLDTPRRQPARNRNKQRRTHWCVQYGQSGIVKIHITYISVKLDKRIPTVLRIRFNFLGYVLRIRFKDTFSGYGNRFYGSLSRGLALIALKIIFGLRGG